MNSKIIFYNNFNTNKRAVKLEKKLFKIFCLSYKIFGSCSNRMNKKLNENNKVSFAYIQYKKYLKNYFIDFT